MRNIILGIVVGVLAHVSLFSLFYAVWGLALWTVLAVALLVTQGRMRRRTRIIAAVALVLLALPATYLAVLESNARTHDLWTRAQAHRLRFVDRTAVYLLGTMLPYGGVLIGAPEVTVEHLLLYVPIDRGRVVALSSSFAAHHPSIEAPLCRFAATLDDALPLGTCVTLASTEVSFPYPGTRPDRISLALNTPHPQLSASAEMRHDGWHIAARITTRITYPAKAILRPYIPHLA